MIEKKKILIVEDELEFAELVKARLGMVGYEATIAVDAYSGTSLALKEDYDLIVLDLMMPAGGGFSMLERLRKFPSKSTVPVVILTGKTIDGEVKEKAQKLKVSAIFAKPYNKQRFIEKINSLIAT